MSCYTKYVFVATAQNKNAWLECVSLLLRSSLFFIWQSRQRVGQCCDGKDPGSSLFTTYQTIYIFFLHTWHLLTLDRRFPALSVWETGLKSKVWIIRLPEVKCIYLFYYLENWLLLSIVASQNDNSLEK